MHIVYVSREFEPSKRAGGIASYIKEIAHGMVRLGHKVTILTASDDTRKQSVIMEGGVQVIRLSGGDFWMSQYEPGNFLKKFRIIYRFYSYRKKVRHILQELPDVDIVEVADYAAEGVFLTNMNFPIVVRLHTPSIFNRSTLNVTKPKITRPLSFFILKAEKKVLSDANYVTSCSQSLLTWMQANLSFNPRLVSVIKNPVSFTDKIQQKHINHSYSHMVFYAGTIVPSKGVEDLFQACREIREQTNVDLQLVLAGKEGKFALQLRKMTEEKGYSWCRFIGKVTRSELYSYYSSADVCCFPSWWENMPMVCLEAMMCGAMVIGSDSGGMSEIIFDGENGFLVPRQNVHLLSQKIMEVLSLSEEKKRQVKSMAQKTISEEFNIEYISKRMLGFYEETIADYKKNKIN